MDSENIFSFDGLIQYVGDFQKDDQIETIKRLGVEESHLEHLLTGYQKQWKILIDLLEKTYQVLLSLQRALRSCTGGDVTARVKGGAATQGIGRPVGWI